MAELILDEVVTRVESAVESAVARLEPMQSQPPVGSRRRCAGGAGNWSTCMLQWEDGDILAWGRSTIKASSSSMA